MRILGLDEMNVNQRRSKSYREYFGEMRITQEQVKRRTALAEDIEEAMIAFFDSLITAERYGMLSAGASVGAAGSGARDAHPNAQKRRNDAMRKKPVLRCMSIPSFR